MIVDIFKKTVRFLKIDFSIKNENQKNHYNICLKLRQEDIVHGSVSNTPGPYRAHRASHPKFQCAQTN
jgi:hypothetical protein